MSMRRCRSFIMLLASFTMVGLLALSPDALSPAGSGAMLLVSFALLVGGLRRADCDSVSA